MHLCQPPATLWWYGQYGRFKRGLEGGWFKKGETKFKNFFSYLNAERHKFSNYGFKAQTGKIQKLRNASQFQPHFLRYATHTPK